MPKKGYKQTEEHKRKILEARRPGTWGTLGKHLSEETKSKISEALTGRRLSDEHKRSVSSALKGRQFSDEHKRKIGDGNRGKVISEEQKRKLRNARRGIKHSEESKRKMSQSQRGRKHSEETKRKIGEAQKGEKHHNWMGGVSFEPYSFDFNAGLRKDVRRRDNYTCQMCFRHALEFDREMPVHHIDYKKKHSSMDNLITLCCRCHGLTNSNRRVWKGFFADKMKVIAVREVFENEDRY